MIIDILNLAKDINKYILSNTSKYTQRMRKINLFDAIIFRLLLTKKGNVQDGVTIDINKYNNEQCSRSSYADRENKLDLNFYKGIINVIDKYVKKDNNSKQVVAVDGTYINILNNIDEFNQDKKKTTITPLISGIYNVTYKYPESLDLVTHKNEINAFKDEYINNEKSKNCIFVFDRGYQSYDLFHALQMKNIKYICRIRQNTKIIDSVNEDVVSNINVNNNSIPIRNINYMIGDTSYHIITNLFDIEEYTVNKIKQLYHNRWDVEEYFKYLKKYHNFDNLNDNNFNKLQKSIYTNLIVSKLIFILTAIKEKKIIKKVNKSILVKGFYDEFIYKFIYYKGFNYKFIRKFMTNYIILYAVRKDRKHERKCKRTTYKWYFKQYVGKSKKQANSQKKSDTVIVNSKNVISSNTVDKVNVMNKNEKNISDYDIFTHHKSISKTSKIMQS